MLLMPVRCDCMKEKARLEEQKAKQADFERSLRDLRKAIGMYDAQGRSNYNSTFANDNQTRQDISATCRKYVNEWEIMRKENIGILFYGSKGTGKTFYAECIVNALAEKGIATGITTTSELILRMQGNFDKEDIMESIRNFSLLVIDDFGAERETSFGLETVYNVVNIRYKAGKPTIFTTNLDFTDMKNEKDISRGRIYDRIIEMCPIQLEMAGESRRLGLSEERKKKARMFFRRKTVEGK